MSNSQSMNPDPESNPANEPIMDEDESPIEEVNPDPIGDDIAANFAMKRIAEAIEHIDNLDKQKQAELAEIEYRYDIKRKRAGNAIQWQQQRLEAYLRNGIQAGQVKPTKAGNWIAEFGIGKLVLKRLPDKVVIADEDAFINANTGTAFVKSKTSLSIDKKLIMTSIKETGEIPTGANIERGTEKFEVKLTFDGKEETI